TRNGTGFWRYSKFDEEAYNEKIQNYVLSTSSSQNITKVDNINVLGLLESFHDAITDINTNTTNSDNNEKVKAQDDEIIVTKDKKKNYLIKIITVVIMIIIIIIIAVVIVIIIIIVAVVMVLLRK